MLPFAPHWFAVLCGLLLFEPQSSDLGAFSQILAGVADASRLALVMLRWDLGIRLTLMGKLF
jgi:hypothetical protein